MNIPLAFAAVTLAVVACISFVKAWGHLSKVIVTSEVRGEKER